MSRLPRIVGVLVCLLAGLGNAAWAQEPDAAALRKAVQDSRLDPRITLKRSALRCVCSCRGGEEKVAADLLKSVGISWGVTPYTEG